MWITVNFYMKRGLEQSLVDTSMCITGLFRLEQRLSTYIPNEWSRESVLVFVLNILLCIAYSAMLPAYNAENIPTRCSQVVEYLLCLILVRCVVCIVHI